MEAVDELFADGQLRAISELPDGAFAVRGLPPGRYRLSAEVRSRPDAQPVQTAYRRIELTNADIGDVVLPVASSPVHDVSGSIDTPSPGNLQVVLAHAGNTVTVRPDLFGRFVIRAAPEGPSQIRLQDSAGDNRSIRAYYDGSPMPNNVFYLDGGPPAQLRITETPAMISVHGSVHAEDNDAASGALVVFWSADTKGYAVGITSATGDFQVSLPGPGIYTVYTADDPAYGPLLEDPEYLTSREEGCPRVTIVPGYNPPLTLSDKCGGH